MNSTDYNTLFESLATQLLGHTEESPTFHIMDYELMPGFKPSPGVVYLFLQPYSASRRGNNMDNIRNIVRAELVVVQHVPQKDPLKRRLIEQDCEVAALAIESELMTRRKNGALHTYDPYSYQINNIGPVFGSCYGWSVNISFDCKL